MPYLPYILLPEFIQKPLLLLNLIPAALSLILLLSRPTLFFNVLPTILSLACFIWEEHRYVREKSLVSYNGLEKLCFWINPRFSSFELGITPVMSQVQLEIQLTGMGMLPTDSLLNQVVHIISVTQTLIVDIGKCLSTLSALSSFIWQRK